MENEFPAAEVPGNKEVVSNGPVKEEVDDKAEEATDNANKEEDIKVIYFVLVCFNLSGCMNMLGLLGLFFQTWRSLVCATLSGRNMQLGVAL